MALIRIWNRAWANGVTVEAQVGNGPTGSNMPIGQTRIAHGGSWDIVAANSNVNYRRDLDPDRPNGQFGDWIDVPNYGRDVDIDV